MDTEQALIDAIVAQPAEDTPRLVLADYYQENGQELRAEQIRLQVQLARPEMWICTGHGKPMQVDPRSTASCGVCESCKLCGREEAVRKQLPVNGKCPDCLATGLEAIDNYLHETPC